MHFLAFESLFVNVHLKLVFNDLKINARIVAYIANAEVVAVRAKEAVFAIARSGSAEELLLGVAIVLTGV